jgi:Fic family protein
MTTKNFEIPAELINKFAKLTNEFESEIRANERQRLLERFQQEFPALKSEPQRARVVANKKIGAGHKRVIELLSGSRFFAIPTIAGLVDVKRSTVVQYLNDLTVHHGFVLEKRDIGHVGNGRKGYRKLYRLVKSA